MAIDRLAAFILDCDEPAALARFYARITGWEIVYEDDDWAHLLAPSGPTIAFQRVPEFTPPAWPGSEHPQQAHLDFEVDDVHASAAELEALGIERHAVQPGDSFVVFADPAGHPFCLVEMHSYRALTTSFVAGDG